MKKIPHGSVALVAFSTALIVGKSVNINPFSHFYFISDFVSYSVLFWVTVLGAFAPDLDYKFVRKETIDNRFWKYEYNSLLSNHRQITHSLLLWVLFFFASLYFKNVFLVFFAIGGLSHLLADYLTGDIPLLLYGYREDKEELQIRKEAMELIKDVRALRNEIEKDGIGIEALEDLPTEEELSEYNPFIGKRYRIGVNYWNNGQEIKAKINDFSDNFFIIYIIVGLGLFILSRTM